MALSDELERLDELRRRGVLSDEEFARTKARLLDDAPARTTVPALAALNALRRSREDRWIAGVCGGLASATGADSWVWRLLFAILFFCGGAGLVIYALLWIFVPAQ
jgi:phage shock protein PspC (stress-responsive transcriptional regulator)